MNWAVLFKDVKYTGRLNFFKAKRKNHYCYKCRSLLIITDLGKTVHIDDAESHLYNFPTKQISRYERAPITECTFFRHAFLCPKCDYAIEIPTQITLEKIDAYLKKIQKRLYIKHNVIIKRVFETKQGKTLETFKNIDDVTALSFIIIKDGKELDIYRLPVLRREEAERARYFKLDKAAFAKFISDAIVKNDALNTLRFHLSEYLGENDIEYSMEDDIMVFFFTIKDYEVKITFDTWPKSYQIKLENNAEKAIQKTIHLTMSQNYAQDLKSVMKDYKLSRKKFADHITGLALMMKKYLARTGNLRFFEQAYYPDFNIDGIVV